MSWLGKAEELSSALLFTHNCRENNWIHTFPKGISALSNAINLVQDLNSCHIQDTAGEAGDVLLWTPIHRHTKGVSPNVNRIAWLEFELTYFMAAVQHVNHFPMGTRVQLDRYINEGELIIIHTRLEYSITKSVYNYPLDIYVYYFLWSLWALLNGKYCS